MRRTSRIGWGSDGGGGFGVLPRARASPVRPHPSSSSWMSKPFSLCYCSFKVYSLNEPLFNFGRNYSRLFRAWFSIGVGFTLAALFGIALILLWELARAFHIVPQLTVLDVLFGSSFDSVSKWNMSFADAGCVFISTLISVSIHELGHALAAAGEGMKAEYFAIFIAVIFPGALMAFDDELLQEMPSFSALRIYCAGIWHNAVCCATFGMILLLLPWILSPIYIHGQNPMVTCSDFKARRLERLGARARRGEASSPIFALGGRYGLGAA
ncbi:hypothetical protein MLD38_036650 [Melastoma candidum]|uniref:Uncharacterized protein n=1 Tax=Melastoma candidum TaxID=119954 RepID=A0ACB9LLC3_9MYRT|nr:hypothetical protein MLD38_036650 [Melastoma candidum]